MDGYPTEKHAADWTPDEVEAWKAAYRADEPVLLPHVEHEEGECDHCDLLRKWMAEVHDETGEHFK